MGLIPARQAVTASIQKGQCIKIINTYGKQVVDFWAFNPEDSHDFLSMVHTRTITRRISPKVGDLLYSTRREPILTFLEDTTPGIHDMIWSACDAERYRMQGFEGYHDNCADNMHLALEGSGVHIASDWVPDPLNLFMNVAIDHRGELDIREPTSEKGQYVVLRAEQDLLIVMSACPQDLAPVNGGKPTDCEFGILESTSQTQATDEGKKISNTKISIPRSLFQKPMRNVKIALSIDFDAVSGWLGTGCHQDNNMADYSSGIFAGRVGSDRLVNMLKNFELADKVTWFIPGHSMETFPESVKRVVDSGAEIGLHGYSHEGIYQMTPEQERDVLLKCIDVATKLVGKKPRGYRAPLYTVRETTLELLREHKFLYDTSLTHHDSQPYWTPNDPPIDTIDFNKDASSWMKPTPLASPDFPSDGQHPLVEIPAGWYGEDMTPLQFLPHLPNSMGYVSTRVIEQMWKDKFIWLWNNSPESDWSTDFIFPILLHPDTSGMAHIIGMIERIIVWLKGWGEGVQFCTHENIAKEWSDVQSKKHQTQ